MRFNDSSNPDMSKATSASTISSLQSNADADENAYWLGIMALCMISLSQSWLMISVFPYSGFMAIDLIDGVNEENAGSYAGLLASAFMAGRATTAYMWGKAADVYGRKFVIWISLVFCSVLSVLFGMSQSFGMAIFWRFLLGLCNGVFGTSKTCVSEMANGNERLETRGMSTVMGMWAWGFLFSPALSGWLSEPTTSYPDSWIVNIFHNFLERNPFILPNLVSVVLCCMTIIAVMVFVPETLPADEIRSARHVASDVLCGIRNAFVSCLPARCTRSMSFSSRGELEPLQISGTQQYSSTGTMHRTDDSQYEDDANVLEEGGQENGDENERLARVHNDDTSSSTSTRTSSKATMSSIWSNQETRNHLLVYWFFSFIVVAVDEAFPLFCISQEGGLGLSEVSIGKILSTGGLIFAIGQYFVYGSIVDRFGLRKSVKIAATVSGPLLCLIPLSLVLNRDADQTESELTWATYILLSVVMAAYRIFSLVFFSSITVLTNRTVIPAHRGTMNGLAMVGGSLTKGIGPTFAGLLVSFCLSSGLFLPQVGATMVFVVLAAVGCGIGAASRSLLKGEQSTAP